MNSQLKLNVRADQRAKRRSREMVEAGQRWEFVKGMYGNVYEVIDHERFRWYRQDRAVDGQVDLFEGALPFHCDYCHNVVDSISLVDYKAIYWYLTNPKLPSRHWKQTIFHVKYACCDNCNPNSYPIPKDLIGYHLTELYQDGIKIFEQERRS